MNDVFPSGSPLIVNTGSLVENDSLSGILATWFDSLVSSEVVSVPPQPITSSVLSGEQLIADTSTTVNVAIGREAGLMATGTEISVLAEISINGGAYQPLAAFKAVGGQSSFHGKIVNSSSAACRIPAGINRKLRTTLIPVTGSPYTSCSLKWADPGLQ